MTQYWITTHWPHPIPDEIAWDVYFRRDRKAIADKLAAGDQVLFYETESVGGKRVSYVRKRASRNWIEVPLRKGGFLVCAATVTDLAKDRPVNERVWQYGNGNPLDFAYVVKCGKHRAGTAIPRAMMLQVLGLSNRMPMHAFRGLRQIDKKQFDQLAKLMDI